MSTIFDSMGIDSGIIIIVLLVIVIILIGLMISNGMRLDTTGKKIQNVYERKRCTILRKNVCT